MSGGGNRVAKGRMSSKLQSEVSPQQLKQLEQTLQTQEQSVEVSWSEMSMENLGGGGGEAEL